MAAKVSIHVSTLAGRAATIEAEAGWKILTIKTSLKSLIGASVAQQRLFYGSDELRNLTVLSEIVPKDTIEVDFRVIVRPQLQVEWLMKIKGSHECFAGAPDDVKADYCVALEAVKQDGNMLRHASEDLRDNRDLVLAAVQADVASGRSASDPTRAARLGMIPVPRNPLRTSPWQFASARLQSDPVFARQAWLLIVEGSHERFAAAPANIQGDVHVAREAIKRDGYMLQYASETLRGNRDLVLAAVRADIELTRSESPYLPRHPRSPMAVVPHHPHRDSPLQFASPELREDPRFVREVISLQGHALKWVSPSLQADTDIVRLSIRKSFSNVQFASQEVREHLRADRDLVKRAIKNDFSGMEFASPDLRQDRDLVMLGWCMSLDTRVSCDAVYPLLSADLIYLGLGVPESLSHGLRQAFNELRSEATIAELSDLHEVALKAQLVKLKYASCTLFNDIAFLKQMVLFGMHGLQYAYPELLSDKDVVVKCMSLGMQGLEHASAELQTDPEVTSAIARGRKRPRRELPRSYLDEGFPTDLLGAKRQALNSIQSAVNAAAWRQTENLERGDVVKATQEFLTCDDDLRVMVEVGTCGIVMDIDAQGNFIIDFPSMSSLRPHCQQRRVQAEMLARMLVSRSDQ
eukprot:TRINITY_DN8829_c0_g2_i1.p1 TRINITY_DN8829_c0_g2~~TRINITY_DN8829_c0_g2_i1.p1  ORF type:complete len:636 (-),score=76.06 TRINITY_DN8829_c0_g2_i1:20-1927(-)